MSIDTPFVRGADRLSRRIRTIRENLGLPDLTEEIGDLLLARTMRRFERGVDPDERPWAPLKPETIRRKARGGFPAKPLQRTLKMKDSIKKIRGGSGSLFTNTGAQVRIGIQDPQIADYARRHQQGRGIPARRFLGIGALDVKAVDSLMRRKARQLERL